MRALKVSSLFILLLGLVAVHGVSEQLGEQELASKSEPRLPIDQGKIVPSKEEPKTDLNILLKDPAMNEKWGLLMTDTKKAWNVSKGSKDIIVAIIDTGADTKHPDLKGNLWINKGETGIDKRGHNKSSNGIDDDGDGFIDDVYGWNFVDGTNDVSDNYGHGTHIAGIIGANNASGKGINGIAPQVSLMILKYFDPKAYASTLTNTVKAIDFAVAHGANIINYSAGGIDPSPMEKAALERAKNKGILVVAAAGNERSNSDIHSYYPADYGLSNIISVTAIDKTKHVLPSSNYGVKTVDLAAPGNEIFSTEPGGKYGFLTGTSQATAFVTGVAVLVMANNRDLKASDVIKQLTQTGDVEDQLSGKTRYRRRLNTYRALTTIDQDVGATGVIAENPTGMRGSHFTLEKSDDQTSEPIGQLSELNQALLKNFKGKRN